MRMPIVPYLSLVLLAGAPLSGESSETTPAPPSPRILHHETVVAAPVDAVWRALTTEEGLRFISGKSRVELRPGGAYEWFLDLPADPQGKRGGEGSTILAFIPREMLAFDWTFPPSIPELRDRDEKTEVVVRLHPLEAGLVRVTLDVHGWQEGEAWDRGWEYFDAAWEAVLGRLKSRLEASHEGVDETVRSWVEDGVRVTVVEGPEKRQIFEIDLAASPDEVWSLLATTEGIRRLGATDPLVELEPGGAYKFWPGNDHQRVLAHLPGRMLAVTGSAPPQFPEVRKGGTWSSITFDPGPGGGTTLRVVLVGWRPGEAEWDAAFDYMLKNNPVFLRAVRDASREG